jgi:hypothetical protein
MSRVLANQYSLLEDVAELARLTRPPRERAVRSNEAGVDRPDPVPPWLRRELEP